MSVVFLTDHNENIYDVTKVEPKYIRKRVYFKSSHSSRLREFYKKCVKQHATMGVPEEEPPDPAKYLKKRTGRPAYIDRCRIPPRDPKIPKTAEQLEKYKIPTVEEVRRLGKPKPISKNFIMHNIKVVTEMKALEPTPKLVIDRMGTKKPLAAGFEPVFTKCDVFGKPPHYLLKFQRAHRKKQYFKKDTDDIVKAKCRYITKEERNQLLSGLKQNWEELQKQYQGLPILTDTIPKRNRKCKIEGDLKQIEKDIVLVERHPFIWVYDDDDDLLK